MLGNAFIAYNYFFSGPAIFSLIIGLLLTISIFRLHKTG